MTDQQNPGLPVTSKRQVGIPSDLARAATGTKHPDLCRRLIADLQQSLWTPGYLTTDEALTNCDAAIAALLGINPKSELEGMLAVQLVATHNAAMECLRRAALPQQTFEGRQASLKYADKLMSLYLRQLDALDKHRGKGKQKVTVQHVYLGAGAPN